MFLPATTVLASIGFLLGAAQFGSSAVISAITSSPPTPTTSAAGSANSTVACNAGPILVENDCPENLIVRVYYDNASWNSWNWTYHGELTISPGMRVPGSSDTTYIPGGRFELGGTFALGSYYIIQGLVPDGCRGGPNNTFAQYRFYNGACDVMHFGDDDDCQFHSR